MTIQKVQVTRYVGADLKLFETREKAAESIFKKNLEETFKAYSYGSDSVEMGELLKCMVENRNWLVAQIEQLSKDSQEPKEIE